MFQFEYNTGRFISSRIQVDKLISQKTFLNFFYDHNYKSNIRSYNVGVRYDLKFMQAGYNFRTNSASSTGLISYFRGSIVQDRKSKYIGYFSRPGMGRSGLVVYAFLDYNHNGIREEDEPKVTGLKFSLMGGSKDWNKIDTSYVVRNLEPYYKNILTIDKNSFEEIAWRISKSVFQIHLSPNQFMHIGVPVEVMGEVSGTIYLHKGNQKITLERILLEIVNDNDIVVAKTISDENGFYNYLGLPPGNYRVRVNTMQMGKLGYRLKGELPVFSIVPKRNGDSKTGIDLEFISD